MGKKKKKGEKKTKVKKYTAKVSVEDRIKQINSIKPPEMDKQAIRENEQQFEHWRPLWRNDRRSLSEKKRVEKRGNRPKRPKQKRF